MTTLDPETKARVKLIAVMFNAKQIKAGDRVGEWGWSGERIYKVPDGWRERYEKATV